MGGSISKRMQVEELVVFKKLPPTTSLANIEIPERPENRRPTDRRYLITYGILVLLLMPFIIYTLCYSDMDRFKGYDTCGNICGKKNPRYDEWSCTGKDLTNKRMMKFETSIRNMGKKNQELIPRECVASCPSGYREIASLCFNEKYYDGYRDVSYLNNRNSQKMSDRSGTKTYELGDATAELEDYLSKVAWQITLACFLSLGVTIATLFLFRWATAAMVWSMLAGFIVLLTIIVITCWVYYASLERKISELLFLCIVATVVLLGVICVMVFLWKKINLVIALLKEAMKATHAMPQLFFLPILTFICQAIIFIIFAIITLYMASSGVLTELVPDFLVYKKNIVMSFTIFFNALMAIWSLQFIIGIQYMVIAGAVAKWYFSTNKNYLDSPILTSASNTFKFHLGTVAFGSLVITLMQIVRALITSAIKNKYFKAIADFCLSSIEQFLKFLSKNAYIMTAMHGKPFYKSGKRAAKIIYQNAINVASINFIGDFILALAQMAIVGVSMVFTYVIMQMNDPNEHYTFAVYVIVFFVSLVVAVTFYSIFETVIDTIFLCFCEDTLLNDGMARPFAMSAGLMEFMDNAKKVYGEKQK